MSLPDKLSDELKIKKITVERITDPQGNSVILLKSKVALLAAGVLVEDAQNSSREYGYPKWEYQVRNKAFYSRLAESYFKGTEIASMAEILLFFISDTYIVHAPYSWGEWVIYEPVRSLDNFLEDLLQHPGLRTKGQRVSDELDLLKSENTGLKRELLECTNEIEALRKTMEIIQKRKVSIEIELDNLKDSLHNEKFKNQTLTKETQYLGDLVKKQTIARLTAEQVDYLKSRNLFPYRVELEQFYPNLIVEFESGAQIRYDGSDGYINIPATAFLCLEPDGTVSEIAPEELMKKPGFTGFDGPMRSIHIIGSIIISFEDLSD